MSFNDVHRARQLFFQSLYQMHMTDAAMIIKLTEAFNADNSEKKYDADYLDALTSNYDAYKEQVEQILTKIMRETPLSKVSPVELCVCRLGVYELLLKSDISHKVIISEALKIQKKFGVEDGYRLVNGVLDTASKSIRSDDAL